MTAMTLESLSSVSEQKPLRKFPRVIIEPDVKRCFRSKAISAKEICLPLSRSFVEEYSIPDQ